MDIQATASKLEKEEMRQAMLRDHLATLKRAGFKCEIDCNTIQGKINDEPFMVYINWVHETQEKFVGVVVTRYRVYERGDVIGEPPVEVLKK